MSRSELVLGAVGDVALAESVESLLVEDGPEAVFRHVIEDLRMPDILFGNMESVLIPQDFPADKLHKRALQSRDHAAECLKLAGFDVMNHATNHVFDCGWRGCLHTKEVLNHAEIKTLGTGVDQQEARSLQIVERQGTTFGFLGYVEPMNWTLEGGGQRVAYMKLPDILEDIAASRDKVDILVVSLHAGLEFREAPSVPRVELCRKIAAAGVDLILCHHPHVPHGVERWGNCLINYSLGNFVFRIGPYMQLSTNTTRSHMFFVTIRDKKIADWSRRYYEIDKRTGVPKPLSNQDAISEDQYYRDLDRILTDPDRLREVWYESSRQYLRQLWESFVKDGPDRFVEEKAWRLLCLDENQNWTKGICELAQREYLRLQRNDFEFTRPNYPFENGANR